MKFDMKIQCKPCNGTGQVGSPIDTEYILDIVRQNFHEGKVDKIPAIKQVREEYGMGLKQAKELVEGAMAFHTAIQSHASESPELPW